MLLEYKNIPENALSARLNFIADILGRRSINFAVEELAVIASELAPTYFRRITGELVTNEEKEIIKAYFESALEESEELEPLVDELFEGIVKDVTYTRYELGRIIMLYRKESRNNLGNKLNQLSDLLAAGRKIFFSQHDFDRIVVFVRMEIKTISGIVGNDY